jgi:hypothetical protein
VIMKYGDYERWGRQLKIADQVSAGELAWVAEVAGRRGVSQQRNAAVGVEQNAGAIRGAGTDSPFRDFVCPRAFDCQGSGARHEETLPHAGGTLEETGDYYYLSIRNKWSSQCGFFHSLLIWYSSEILFRVLH